MDSTDNSINNHTMFLVVHLICSLLGLIQMHAVGPSRLTFHLFSIHPHGWHPQVVANFSIDALRVDAASLIDPVSS